MARIRTVKPMLFRHEDLFEAEQEAELPLRLAFIGLFTCADREGRFEWRPRALKLDVMPYDDVDFSRVLDALCTRGFVVKYEKDGALYGCIPSFTKHQVINNREAASDMPDPCDCTIIDASGTRDARVTEEAKGNMEGKGREGNMEGKELARSAGADETDLAIQAYSSLAESLDWPIPRNITGSRKAKLRARLQECGGIDGWRAAMAKARASPFLRGESGRGSTHEKWVPDLDFFLQQASFTRLMEGKYDDRDSNSGPSGFNAVIAGARAAVAG